MDKCIKCDVEMKLIEWGEPIIGDMGEPVKASYYRCWKCNGWKFCPDPSVNLLAQTIDKKILDELIKLYVKQ